MKSMEVWGDNKITQSSIQREGKMDICMGKVGEGYCDNAINHIIGKGSSSDKNCQKGE